MNYKNELKKKISADYERRVKQWMSSDPAQLVDAAETIAAARLIHDNLDDAITTQDAKFLLDLDDPLGYVTDRWISENGADNSHKEELQHCVWTLQQDFGEGQAPATVRDFLMEHKGGVFSLMTPCGYVSLTEAQAESLLDGHGIKSHPGMAGVSMEVSADEILTQTVKSANRQNGVWYLLTESPEQTQSPPEMEEHVLKRVLRSRRGEGYIDVCVLVICAMLVIALAVKIMPVYIAKQQLDTFATELVREAELYGRVGTETTRRAQSLREQTGLDPDISWSSTGRIQLNQEITVILTYETNLGLFAGFGSFPITLRSEATGKSEVYWK